MLTYCYHVQLLYPYFNMFKTQDLVRLDQALEAQYLNSMCVNDALVELFQMIATKNEKSGWRENVV